MKEVKELLKIISCFINNTEYKSDENINEEHLYKLAKHHNVSNFLVNWANKNCQTEKVKNDILTDYNTQIIKDTNENIELENILKKFEETQIKTLIVKGVIMKDVYPQSYMRQMCDIDIMIQEKDFKKASKIMADLKFNEFYDHEKHLVFTKEPFIIIEMHRKLIPGGDVSSKYFNDIWPNCIKYNNYENVYKMDINDAYIFCIIHLIRHFRYAGIEIRDVLDVYLYYEKFKNDFDYNKLNQKFEEFEAKEFEENIRKIAYKWFEEDENTEFNEVEKFIFKGQSIDNNINYGTHENNGKEKYILRLFFPEFKIMREKYPILKKAPILLPATWIARLFKDIFSKETTVKARLDTIKKIQNVNQDDVDKIHKIYKKLGIKERK